MFNKNNYHVILYTHVRAHVRHRYDDIIMGFYGKAFAIMVCRLRRQVPGLSYFQPIRI